jgi:hypothetical protein
MKTKSLALVWAMVLVPPATVLLAQARPAPIVGHVLMLDNESVLEGDITREGERYVIKRPVGEIKVPVGKALVVCASMDEAFKILSSRANLRDPDERTRLARWCQSHGMQDRAIEETKAALELRPSHADAKRLLTMLQHSQASAGQTAAVLETVKTVAETPLLEVSGDCLALFATRVQPIMMNTCATCHANSRTGNFVLTRSTDAAGRRATQVNLSAALKQICFEQPSSSPLLYKACCAHGGAAQPPLGANQVIPYETLKGWVELVVARNPHLRSEGAQVAAGPAPGPSGAENSAIIKSMPATAPSTFRSVPVTAEASAADATVSMVPGISQSANALKELATLQAAPLASNDPHDPMIFNQMFHPKQ